MASDGRRQKAEGRGTDRFSAFCPLPSAFCPLPSAFCRHLSALSRFNRIFTKLYGGHGPVYRNESLFSYFFAISEI